ncbi:MAG TPA: asparagine synthase (glutamine-hydrolyzing), partial [Bacillota bacterium]|nr:asparagine synthase (glutamine-hydrolyzing) [Bacillota bacterium]
KAKEYIIQQQEITGGSSHLIIEKKEREHHNASYQIVCDGDILNKQEMYEALKCRGYEVESMCTEAILTGLYVCQQEHMLKYIRGAFSFIIWDPERELLFGARDPFGMKPFYYMEYKNEWYFASEMKYFEGYMHPIHVSHTSLQRYFSFQFVPGNHTMFGAISTLEPGTYFYKKDGQSLDIQPYWKPEFCPSDTETASKIQNIQETLRSSVQLHMQSEKKIGAFLSGGVDSSAIVALAREVDPNIQTFTVGFEREGYSEISIAKETAGQLQVENIHYVIQPEEFVGHLRQIIYHLGEPIADPAAIPLYFATREARKHVDIVLSGEGADELFGGYNIYREPRDLKVFRGIPKPIQSMLKKVASVIPAGVRGKSFIERGTTPLAERFIGNAHIFAEDEKKLLLVHHQPDIHFTDITKGIYEETSHLPEELQMQSVDVRTWLPGDILVKADRMATSHGLELRMPFLDTAVFQVASQLRAEESITKETTKYALREAMRGIVPDSVLYNRKLGFPVPIRHWLKHELYHWAKETIEQSNTGYLIHKSYVLELLETHRSGKLDVSRKLWTVLSFMIWHEIYME